MAMQYDGKTYRNLQEQVAYLTAKWQQLADEIDAVRAQIPSKMIVEELPEEGDPLITYYVGPKGTEPNLYYEVWIWVQEEPEGPFVWREHEDTDQVDLSGYLEKQTGATTNAQVYMKNPDGTQRMIDATNVRTNSAIVVRTGTGQVLVPDTQTDGPQAVSKNFADGHYVAKSTGAREYWQAYMVDTDGNPQMVDSRAASALPNAIATRTSTGQLIASNPTDDVHLVPRGYADGRYLAKQTGTSSYPQLYCKKTDGTQEMRNVSYDLISYSVPLRDSNGGIKVPTTPINNGDAASKAYVDAAVGQLLYLHDIEIIVTVDATNKLYIKAYLINGSSTAITAIDRAIFKRMDVQYGAFGPNIANVTTCAVTKCPDSLRQDEFDEPYPAYLYQYMSGGSLVSGATTYAMSVTVTDSVITF